MPFPLSKSEHFSHGADIGIRGVGDSMEKAFEMAALALTAVVTNPENISSSIIGQIQLDEKDPELLFYDWINSLIYEMDTKKMLFSKFKVSINAGHLKAEIKGETMNKEKHDLAVEVKGGTMTELKVVEQEGHWIAQCVVDV